MLVAVSPKSRGRPAGRGKQPRRHPRPSPRPVTALDLALREAPSLYDGDLLSAQTAASEWLGKAWGARGMSERDPEKDLVRAIVNAAGGGSRADAAVSALFALATIPDQAWHDDLVTALADVPSVRSPAWAVDPVRHRPPAPTSAQLWSDPWDANRVHLLRYETPVPHTLFVAETTVGGRYVQVIDVGVEDPSRPLEPRAEDDLEVADVEPADGLAEVADALWQTDMYWPPQNADDYTIFRAYAHWLTRGHRRETDWEPLPDDERERLLDEFAGRHGLDLDDDVVRLLADTFVDFGDGYLHGGILAWSPGEVEHFLLDWIHRKVILEPEVQPHVPEALRAWVAFALARRGLKPEHIDPVVDAVRELEDAYAEASTDSALHGPAKEITSRLIAAGVDLHDEEAVNRAIGQYNAEQIARRMVED